MNALKNALLSLVAVAALATPVFAAEDTATPPDQVIEVTGTDAAVTINQETNADAAQQ